MFKVYFNRETAFLVLIPMLVILFLNIGIIYRLKASTKRHKTMTNSEETNKQREQVQRNMTISLLTVSFAFIILHTPMAVHNLASFAHFETTERKTALTSMTMKASTTTLATSCPPSISCSQVLP